GSPGGCRTCRCGGCSAGNRAVRGDCGVLFACTPVSDGGEVERGPPCRARRAGTTRGLSADRGRLRRRTTVRRGAVTVAGEHGPRRGRASGDYEQDPHTDSRRGVDGRPAPRHRGGAGLSGADRYPAVTRGTAGTGRVGTTRRSR